MNVSASRFVVRSGSCPSPVEAGGMSSASRRQRHADSTQLVRQWAILQLLASGTRSYSVRDLAEQLGTSKSTVERDLATLERHFPLLAEEEGKQKRRYRLARAAAMPPMQFGLMELAATHAFASAVPGLEGTALHEDLLALLHKLRAALAPHHNGAIDRIAAAFAPHPRAYVDYSGHGDILDALVDATLRRRECQVTYLPGHATAATENVIHPLRLVWHQHALYAFCWYPRWRWLGVLAAHRIQALAPTGQTFRPPRFDLDQRARQAFGIFVGGDPVDVEIRFAPAVARFIGERVFHPDEQKLPEPDGGLRYRVRTGAKWEVVAWVQRFGGLAELIAPGDWREAVRAGAEAMAAAHRAA